MLPRVKIYFENGVLGQVAEMADGCLGLLALGAVAVADTFALGEAYKLKGVASLEALGVTAENNPLLYKNVKEFYDEAGNGQEMWLMGFAATSTFASILDRDNASGAKALLLAANGNPTYLRKHAQNRTTEGRKWPVAVLRIFNCVMVRCAKVRKNAESDNL